MGWSYNTGLTPVNYKDTSSMLGRSSLAPSPDYLSARRLEHMWEVPCRNLWLHRENRVLESQPRPACTATSRHPDGEAAAGCGHFLGKSPHVPNTAEQAARSQRGGSAFLSWPFLGMGEPLKQTIQMSIRLV